MRKNSFYIIFCLVISLAMIFGVFSAINNKPVQAGKIKSADSRCKVSEAYVLDSNITGWSSKIVVDQNKNIYTLWSNNGLMFSMSDDGGQTFSQPINIAPEINPDGITFEMLSSNSAENGEVLYVVARQQSPEDKLYLLKGFNNGTNWKIVSEFLPEDFWGGVGFAAYEGKIMIAYITDDENIKLRVIETKDDGQSWNNTPIYMDNEIFPSYPSLSINNQGAHLVFAGTTQEFAQGIYYSYLDGVNSFSYPTKLSLENSFPVFPRLATDNSGHVFVSWQDQRFGFGYQGGELFMRRSFDNGQNFLSEQRVTYTTQYNDKCNSNSGCVEFDTSLAIADNGLVFVTWSDLRGFYFNTKNIRALASYDFGETWGEEMNVSQWPAEQEASGASITQIKGNKVFHSWTKTPDINEQNPRSVLFNSITCL